MSAQASCSLFYVPYAWGDFGKGVAVLVCHGKIKQKSNGTLKTNNICFNMDFSKPQALPQAHEDILLIFS